MMKIHSPIYPPTKENIEKACELLRQDQVCAFPTETVYGLGANAFSEKAILQIYKLKGRPLSNPLIVHVSCVDMARSLVVNFPPLAEKLAAQFWPGPLTLILQRNPSLPSMVSAGRNTVAIRVPSHPVAQLLLQESKLPLCAPSANRSEQLSPTLAKHVVSSLPEVPMVLDGGPCPFGIESTVVDLTAPVPRILRPGALSIMKLRDLIPKLQVPSLLPQESTEGLLSPGMMLHHYAPKALFLMADSLQQFPENLPTPIGVLVYQNSSIDWVKHTHPDYLLERLPNDPEGYAADLYAALHRLDESQVACILAETPPKTEEWIAIWDRLSRAAKKI